MEAQESIPGWVSAHLQQSCERRVGSGRRLERALADERVPDLLVHEFACRLATGLYGLPNELVRERTAAVTAKRAWMKGSKAAAHVVGEHVELTDPLDVTARLVIRQAAQRTQDRRSLFLVATLAQSHWEMLTWYRFPEMGLQHQADYAHPLGRWRKIVRTAKMHARAARFAPQSSEPHE